MSCTTRHQATHQLQCNFPDSLDVASAIAVYFTPQSGSERRVVNCVQLEDLECTYEDGFKCELLTSNYAEITVPSSFQQLSGTFRCQMPGISTVDTMPCQWTPSVTQIPDDFSQATATFSTSQYLENNTHEAENKDNTVAVIVSVAVVLVTLLLIVLVVGITLVKKRMEGLKKHKLENLNIGGKLLHSIKISKLLQRPRSSSVSSTDSDASERTPRRRDPPKKIRSKESSLAPLSEKGT